MSSARLALFVLVVLSVPVAAGDPAYPFARPPLEAVDLLPNLRMGKIAAVPADERQILQRAWDLASTGKPLTDDLLLDATLFASGVERAEQRTEYRTRIDKLVTAARTSIGQSRDVRTTGERLLRFLHGGVLAGEYKADQSSVAAAIDTGNFNCVSASAVYYLVGSRLGLDLQVVTIPGLSSPIGHVALDLVDGAKRVQVEATNPNGFDWAATVSRPDVVIPLWVPDRKHGRDARPGSLPAITYSNRGVEFLSRPAADQLTAARNFLSALCLDPANDTAGHNLRTVFGNWGRSLADRKKFAEALRVLGFGHAMAPKDNQLRWNHTAVWKENIRWLLGKGRDADAVAANAHAARALPNDSDFRDAANWYENLSHAAADNEQWERALDVVDRGLKVLDDTQAAKLRDWRGRMFRHWSQAHLSRKDCAGSLQALKRAYALDPTSRSVRDGLVCHIQEALKIIDAGQGREAVFVHFRAVREAFPREDGVKEAAVVYVARKAERLAQEKKFAEAVAVVDLYAPLLDKPADRTLVGAEAYGDWARDLFDRKAWPAALAKYAEGLKAYPESDRLRNRACRTVQDQAEPAADRKDWTEVARIYREALRYLTDDRHLKSNLEVYEARAKGK